MELKEKTISNTMADKTLITWESYLCSLVIIFSFTITMTQYPKWADPEKVLLSWKWESISYYTELENNKTFSFYTSVDI